MQLTILNTLLALAALGWGIVNQRRARDLAARLDSVRSAHFRLTEQHRDTVERMEETLRAQGHQVRALQGGALFQAEMTVGEAIALDPRVSDVLGAFHIGGCDSCATSPDETLARAAMSSGQDAETILTALNRLASGDASIQEQLDRRPNVQLSL